MMGDSDSISQTYDGEEHLFAAARHMIKALRANKNLNDEVRNLLADLDSHLSVMTKLPEDNLEETRELEERLKFAKKKILCLEFNRPKIWDSGTEKFSEYLQAIQEIQRLTESLRSLFINGNGKQKQLLNQAHSVLQLAMSRLEEELIYILAQNRLSFEPDYIWSPSCEEEVVFEESIILTEDDSVVDTSRRASSGTESGEHSVDLVHPDIIPHIKSIANVMFASSYDQEFCHAFVSFWKYALEESLIVFGIGALTIEDLLKMEWRQLSCKIKKWIWEMKIVIRVYLASKKWLFDQVLGEYGSLSSTCFIKASKDSVLFLLNFGVAVAIYPRQPERLFDLLDLYEALADLVQDIDALFSGQAGSLVRIELHELLMRLGDSAKATFMEFGNAVASRTSTTPFPGGGIHHLTKYVMNYINTVIEYSGTLNILLGSEGGEESVPVSIRHGRSLSSHMICPLASNLQALTLNLETSIEIKSRLYKDGSLKHIFMMNNIHYMVQKVKGTALGTFFGDEWIKDYTRKFQQHATSYERVTWNGVLDLLRDDGNKRKAVLKHRCKVFNVTFEEVYKAQASWYIPDSELRNDLRISISQKVVRAYRSFIWRSSSSIGEKYIKYTEDDLENYILNLFEGWTRSLRNSIRR